ncbi:MAG: efflux RND transporter periplasmic adaptor subunit [Longimicrobiales bacterium]
MNRVSKVLALLVAGVASACAGDSAHLHEEEEHEEEHAGMATLDSAGMELGGVRTGEPVRVSGRTLRVTGTIGYDPLRVAHVGPKIAGRIVQLDARVGSRVGQGTILVHLESAEVGSLRAELLEAEALLVIARERYDREVRLEGMGISSHQEVREAEAELRGVEARRSSAQVRLRVMGAEHHPGGDAGHFDLVSPLAGTVVEMHTSPGEVVGAESQVLTVADLGRLWVLLDVYERDLAAVREGQGVEVTTAAYPDRSFPGRIAYVGEILDPVRRTVEARVEVQNGEGFLMPGMFATADVQVGGGEGALAVPRDAVQLLEGDTVVWVPTGEPGSFRTQPVRLGGELGGGLVEILGGLEPGARLVVAGAFTLKAELLKGQFADHVH